MVNVTNTLSRCLVYYVFWKYAQMQQITAQPDENKESSTTQNFKESVYENFENSAEEKEKRMSKLLVYLPEKPRL